MENKKITVLGAGYMGSAITFPLSDQGFSVSLWGTWLDDDIIKKCKNGPHPKLGKELPENVTLYSHPYLKEAVNDSDIIILGITSEGFLPVFTKLLDVLEDREYLFFSLTKGLLDDAGNIVRISKTAKLLYGQKFDKNRFYWSSIGGPVKAKELSERIPTVSVYSAESERIADTARSFITGYYNIVLTDDVAGLEVSSALKNIYAVALGMLDGIYMPAFDNMYHNFSSWMFSQSIKEMSYIAQVFGGRESTVKDFAGTGDLYVTAKSGRNRKLGELIGKGMAAEKANALMLQEGETAEGYHALFSIKKWLDASDGYEELSHELPLMRAIINIFCHRSDVLASLQDVLCKIKGLF